MNSKPWSAKLLSVACLAAAGWLTAACGAEGPGDSNTADGGDNTGDGGAGGNIDPNANTDGDCMTDLEEIELGTDPNSVDTDGDGFSDCDEIACVSDPLNGAEKCYACGWAHNDPGDIVTTGSNFGDVIADFELIDQCGEAVSIYDFAGSYQVVHLVPAY